MSTPTEEFARTCARTGEELTGKFYVLKTTEGEELVSAAAFWGDQADPEVSDDDQGDQGDQVPPEVPPAPVAKVPGPRKPAAVKGK